MDDIRVGSISNYDPFQEGQRTERVGDRKERRHRPPPQDEIEDGFATSLEEAETQAPADGMPQDYYAPSKPQEE
jgi:hypothetical protein